MKASVLDRLLNKYSAIGDRHRFAVQTKSTRKVLKLGAPDLSVLVGKQVQYRAIFGTSAHSGRPPGPLGSALT